VRTASVDADGRVAIAAYRRKPAPPVRQARGMRDWPDPEEPQGSGLLLHLEFWAIAAITLLGFGMAYGPRLMRFIRSMF